MCEITIDCLFPILNKEKGKEFKMEIKIILVNADKDKCPGRMR